MKTISSRDREVLRKRAQLQLDYANAPENDDKRYESKIRLRLASASWEPEKICYLAFLMPTLCK